MAISSVKEFRFMAPTLVKGWERVSQLPCPSCELENVTRKRKDGPRREVAQKPSAVVGYNR